MQFTNLTRQNEIGANCYYVQSNNHGYLLDCGSHPKIEGNGGLPLLNFLSDKPLHGAFISHGHLDHLGSLPIIMSDRPEIRAYLTQATSMIAERALHNSASVMIKQRAELHLPEYPRYTHGQVDRVMNDFTMVPFKRTFEIEGAKVTYYEAGHVQGAAGIWIEAKDQSLFYTGDVKFSDMKITRGAQFPDQRPDVMVIECTRGSTPSQPDFSWQREIERLALSIQETHRRGGSVLIPCFALGKTQEVLKILHDLMQDGTLREQPVYISGLGRSYTEIYDDLANRTSRVCPGFKLEKSLDLIVLEQKEGLTMKLGGGRLMLISSGMMTPRTMSYAMAQRILPGKQHSIFFVGYVDPETPAGKLKAGGQGALVNLGGDVGEIEVQCQVNSFDLTSHCNREHMLDYVVRIQPPHILLVHGEVSSLSWFQQELARLLPNSKVTIPPSGQTLDFA